MLPSAFRWIAASLVLLAATASAQDPAPLKPFLKLDYARHRLTRAELKPLFEADAEFEENEPDGSYYLPIVRALVFGRHGRIFRESSLQDFLNDQKWYRPNPKFRNESLNAVERANIDLIRELEARAHWRVSPGDLRFWRDRPLKIEKGTYFDVTNLRIMQAEIEAIHGKVFTSQPLLQRYFEDRYWYRPNPKYRFAQLGKIEQANLKTLRRLEAKSHDKEWFAVGDPANFERKVIPKSRLESLSLYELRIARNTLYAMHGYRFRVEWLREYFESAEWYTPVSNPEQIRLAKTDETNLRNILAMEARRHEELSRKPVTKKILTGLFIEDLRRLAEEIPARHGKVFRDPSLRAYFESLPWYRPNARYRSSMLSKVERQNLTFLQNAMKSTTRQFALEEG